ncbi:universal stress protein UspA [Ligilactobacillus salitolerans]|uniref:Universal stress protein UspA n=1 Tax=Ligilactobacillus salitolerans TaxID=1808352 RepID=A0A401ISC3_9LACO|nr:universal stress protein [Ligilactobacillus salitolerans]GBG94429.1 universal stress protein UspA [Ligilactobacillus salitolerans]
MYQNILVPLDGSGNSKRALDEAINLSEKFGSHISILSVVNESNMIFTTGSPDMILSGLKSNAEDIVERGKKQAADRGVEVEAFVERGIPKQIIATEFPQKHDIDLIVIGKSGVDAFDRLLIGSTTSYVVRKSNVKILVVNNDEEETKEE